MVLKIERDIRGSRGDEDSIETRRETYATKAVSTEPMLQRMCQS